MKRIMILWAVLSLGLGAFAQPAEPPYTDDGELFRQLGFPEWRENRKGNESILLRDDSTVFSDVDVDPQYPGGIDSVYEWISRNFDYSGMGGCCAIGRVIVSFIVETDGSITDVVKLRDIGCRIADRVVNAVSIMPKWIPGKLNDKAVRVRYVLAYPFFIR
ncbi:MAG: hypothetical protein IJR26_10590 [Bacteroidales bacterium]|nr:hypothetical protein [Bacteroidales bacterium]